MDRISVIVPVYKTEAYLDRCIQSIVDQTYTHLEIILVDDGSPDNCPQMCDEWAVKDSRIRVIHKENGGLSDARNVGVAAAGGEYIAFVDSDDWIEREMLFKLYQCIIRDDSNIASCGALRVWDDATPSQPMLHFSGNYVLEGKEALKALIQSTYLIQVVWNKLYSRQLIENIPFRKGIIHEDEFWSWQTVAKASKVSVLQENLYNYYQRDSGIMGHKSLDSAMLMIEAKMERTAYIQKYVPELNDINDMDVLCTCHYLGCEVQKRAAAKERSKYMKHLEEIARYCIFSKSYIEQQPIKKRIRSLMMRKWLRFVCCIDVALGRT